MKITPNQPFRHVKTAYEQDVEVEVPDALGFYFVNNGWASADPETIPEDLREHMHVTESVDAPSQDPGPVDLSVDPLISDQGTEVR